MLRFLPTAARVAGTTLVAALLFSGSASAQTTAQRSAHPAAPRAKTTQPVARQAAPRTAAMGTFQLIQLSDKVQMSLTTDALTEIEKRRHETNEVSWSLGNARVRILPRQVINAPGFQPLTPTVSYSAAR